MRCGSPEIAQVLIVCIGKLVPHPLSDGVVRFALSTAIGMREAMQCQHFDKRLYLAREDGALPTPLSGLAQ